MLNYRVSTGKKPDQNRFIIG